MSPERQRAMVSQEAARKIDRARREEAERGSAPSMPGSLENEPTGTRRRVAPPDGHAPAPPLTERRDDWPRGDDDDEVESGATIGTGNVASERDAAGEGGAETREGARATHRGRGHRDGR